MPAIGAPVDDAARHGCVARVLADDDRLGAARNHAPESGPIARAAADYADALDALDFASCPPAFVAAFRRHAEAWRLTARFLTAFPDARGEMHAVFKALKARPDGAALADYEKAIWDSWAEVEAATPSAPDRP